MDDENRTEENRFESVDKKIYHLTDAVSQVVSTMATIQTNMEHIGRQVIALTNDIKAVTNKKFEWSTLIAAVVLLLAMWAAAINPIETNQEKQEDSINDLRQDIKFLYKAATTTISNKEELAFMKKNTNQTMQNRFTDDDGARLRSEVYERLDVLEQLIYQHQLGDVHK